MQLIVILLILIIITLAGLSLALLFYYLRINKAVNLFLEKGKVKDAREVLFSQIKKTKEMESELKKALNRIKLLENSAKVSFQKIGVVRFNPFENMGGNQSFAIALLDSQNNGFVISSLFIKEGSRIYAKPVASGKSEHVLSAEEQEAIIRAIKNNG